LLTGLTIGFGHCIGMCGPLVISFSLSLKPGEFFVPHLLYHFGRTLTYMVMGAIMGATGSFTIVAANIAGLQKAAMFIAGGVIISMGLAMGGWIPRFKIFNVDCSPAGAFSRIFKKMSNARSVLMYLPMGLVLGLLPCGPVYTTLLGAARAGMEAPRIYHGMVVGMMLMLAFGMGTIPALFLVAKLADMGWLKYRDKIYKAGAVLMVGVGIYFIITAIKY
jgi:sulfite exporter TauE/SafE